MAGESREAIDLKKLQEYINAANKLGTRLQKIEEQQPKIKIDPPPGWIKYPAWDSEVKKISDELSIDTPVIFGTEDLAEFSIPYDRAKNWGYLTFPTGDHCYLKVVGELSLTEFLALYRAYEEGVLREIIAKLERVLPEVKKKESLIRKIDEIIVKIGINPVLIKQEADTTNEQQESQDRDEEWRKVEVRKVEKLEKSLRFELWLKASKKWMRYYLYLEESGLTLQYSTTIEEEVERAIEMLKMFAYYSDEIRMRERDDVYYIELYTENLGHGPLKETVLELLEKYGDLAVESGIVSKAQLAWMKAMVERTPIGGWEYGLNVEVDEGGRLKIYAYDRKADRLAGDLASIGLRKGEHYVVYVVGEEGEERTKLEIKEEGVRELARVAAHGEEYDKETASEILKELRAKAEIYDVKAQGRRATELLEEKLQL